MFFLKYIYQLRSGFFFVLRTDKIYMDLLLHYFLENLWKNYNWAGAGGDKNLDVHSLFQGGGSFKLDGCGRFALFCGRHKWIPP